MFRTDMKRARAWVARKLRARDDAYYEFLARKAKNLALEREMRARVNAFQDSDADNRVDFRKGINNGR